METITLRPIGRLLVACCLIGSVLCSGCAQNQQDTAVGEAVGLNAPQANRSFERLSRPEQRASGKTTFHFEEQGPFTLAAHEQKTVTVLYSPTYEGVSAIEVVIKYDPAALAVSELQPADGITPFRAKIDAQAGTIALVAAADKDLYGEKLKVFSFTVTAQPTETPTESVLSFEPAALHALLPDVANTDTAVREVLPRMVFSLR